MRRNVGIVFAATMSLSLSLAVGCKKGGGTGGGGGSWLVGSDGLMANLDANGDVGPGYDLGADVTLRAIACRGAQEAWVAGDDATLLYTPDAGASWTAQTVPVTGALYSVASQDAGAVFVAGDGAFLRSVDAGTHWAALGDAGTHYRAVAAAQAADTVLALDDQGGVWSYADGALARTASIPGARAIAVSPDGQTAVVAGTGLQLSTDGGRDWLPLAGAAGTSLRDVRVDDEANVVAVGAAGTIVTVTWGSTVAVQHVGTADLYTVHTRSWDGDESTGFAGGAGGEVLLSDDLGATWTFGPNLGRDVYGIDQLGAGHR